MNAGYLRLSRDDDKKNYVSIENQKLIISQYAAEHGEAVGRWYEDDGVSGYIFDRPGFQALMADLEKDIDTVYVKDFSRLGRHNAKVLLLLDEFQERGKRLIVIDDNYDSINSSDDTIGIKTWFNERYVKDTSRKIKRAIGARQKEGTLLTQPPFGYRRNKKDKSILEIVPKEAEYVKMIFDLYTGGYGYRRIAGCLTDQGAPTPSMIRHERELEEGRVTKRAVAAKWSDSMVKDLLGNDFYIGTLRLRKRARNTVHGKDRRVPKEEQYVFKDHHPAIIDRAAFQLAQELKEKRNRTNYRGGRGQLPWAPTGASGGETGLEMPNPFGSCLFCKDCGKRLTPIKRDTRKYYICTTYNTKGRRYCPKAHLIEEADLTEDVLTYIRMCRNVFCEAIAAYDRKTFEADRENAWGRREELQRDIAERKDQLKALLGQKIRDLANVPESVDIINESYDALQRDIMSRIHGLESQLAKLTEASLETPEAESKRQNALEVLDKIISDGILGRRDIEFLIDRIVVDEDGFPEIQLKRGLSGLISHSPAEEMNRGENTIFSAAMKLVLEDGRGYTSARYLSEHLTELGCKKSRHSVLPYIAGMKERGILEAADNSLKPYTIIRSETELRQMIKEFDEKHRLCPAPEQNLHGTGDGRRYARNGF